MGCEPVEEHGVARGELRRLPVQRLGDVVADHPAIIRRQQLVDTVREPEATRLDRAFVDRNEDGEHARDARIGQPILVRPEARASRLLVVDLVLEGGRRLAESPGRDVSERTIDERSDTRVTGGDVLRAAYGGTLADLLCVLAPDVAADRP